MRSPHRTGRQELGAPVASCAPLAFAAVASAAASAESAVRTAQAWGETGALVWKSASPAEAAE